MKVSQTRVVDVPPERVWRRIAQPEEFGRLPSVDEFTVSDGDWPRPGATGALVLAGGGERVGATFKVLLHESEHEMILNLEEGPLAGGQLALRAEPAGGGRTRVSAEVTTSESTPGGGEETRLRRLLDAELSALGAPET